MAAECNVPAWIDETTRALGRHPRQENDEDVEINIDEDDDDDEDAL
jgi:hypothetical protein